jgi:hypothetical protein
MNCVSKFKGAFEVILADIEAEVKLVNGTPGRSYEGQKAALPE